MIVGVMPRSFAFNDIAGVGDVYLPASLMRAVANGPAPSSCRGSSCGRTSQWPPPTRRSSPSCSRWRHIHSRVSGWHLELQPIIVPYQQNTGRTSELLLAGVVLLLIIGCANCSILLLARGRARQHELAIRTCDRRQPLAHRPPVARRSRRHLLAPAPSLALLRLTGLPGFPLSLSPDSFPAESVIRINASVLAFSVALALFCGILFGLAPALRLSRNDPARALPGRQAGSVVVPAGIAGAFSSRRR